MNKNRLENFSDGVFSIAVTLLILNVKIPDMKDINNNQLYHILYNALPHLGSFAFSFIVIGVFWVAHHRIFSFVEIPDSRLLWINILYLLFIAIIPLSADILSANPFLPNAIMIYTGNLFIIALMNLVLLRYILSKQQLRHRALTPGIYKIATRTAIVGPVCYFMAAASSLLSVYISFLFIAVALTFYVFFSGKSILEDKMLKVAKKEKKQP